jgi:hypothetical protein
MPCGWEGLHTVKDFDPLLQDVERGAFQSLCQLRIWRTAVSLVDVPLAKIVKDVADGKFDVKPATGIPGSAKSGKRTGPWSRARRLGG